MEGFNSEEMDHLQALFRTVKEIFKYRSDQDTYHVADYWADDKMLLPSVDGRVPFEGDCEDYAMTCMHRAMNEGFDARLVVCWTETNEGHCICEVAAPDHKQALYLDNRQTRAVFRSKLKGYRFYSVSPWNPIPADTRPWHLVKT